MSDANEPPSGDPQPGSDWELPSERCIRLLKITFVIDATEETKEDSIFFSIKVFDLDNCPSFLALSYSWSSPVRSDIYSTEPGAPAGDQSVKTFFASYATDAETGESIRDDQGRVDVRNHRDTRHGTKNLRDALVQLYRLGLGEFYFWADAICIDQDNLREKESQVAMMDEIYSTAQAVVVWLGPADADDIDAQSWLWVHQDLMGALETWTDNHSIEELRFQKPLDPNFTSQLGVTPPGGSWMQCWARYFNFYRQRTWFSRAWVVQEVALAGRIMVQCGAASLSWSQLVAVGDLLTLLGWQLVLAPDVSRGFGRAMADEITRLSAIKDNVERKQVRNTTQSPPTITTGAEETGEKTGATDVDMDLARKTWYYEFEALLHNTRVYSATDPRDKIYAILGIAKRSLPPGMPMPIMPDYSAASTARSLFTSVATMLLRERPRLVLLSFVQDKESTRAQDLPSWVPDWTCPLTGVPLTLMRKTACDFNCDPSRDEVGALFEVQEGCLALQGAQFDRIAEVAAPMWDIVKTQVIDSLLVLCENLSTEYLASHSGPGEVLWRTMVANTSDEQPAPASLATSFKAWASIRLARTVTPEILERDPTQELGFRNNTALDEEAIQSKLGLLKRLITQEENQSQLRAAGSGESATPTSSFPTIDNVLETCRLIHRTKLHAFIAQNSHFVTLDPHDPLPSIEEWVMRIEGTALAFQNAMAPALPFRRLYRTVGGYLGLGPASAQVGDQVWMIRGARVPFVLRDRSDPAGTFELLGATYVHGFMDGEMAAKVEGFRAVVIE